MEYKTINWTGKKGNKIELRAHCTITMQDRIDDCDGDMINVGKGPHIDANLELLVDDKVIDSCWNTAFWQIIDTQSGIKKVWGLRVGMSDEQAKLVAKFLNDVIASGKSEAVKEDEKVKSGAEKAEKVEAAKDTIAASESTIKNHDGSLMTDKEAAIWKKRYNDINNEGGEGYVPSIITVEAVEYARSVLKEFGEE